MTDEPKKGPGRPTKFTPDRVKKLLDAIQGGNYRETACKYAGISHQTLRNWIHIAQRPDAPSEYVEFLEALERAEAEAEIFDIGLIRRAARDGGQWQAAAWMRERKNPERWGRRDATKIELTGADGGPVEVRHGAALDVQAMESLANVLLARQQDAAEAAALTAPVDVDAWPTAGTLVPAVPAVQPGGEGGQSEEVG
jgi:hypothetical protein